MLRSWPTIESRSKCGPGAVSSPAVERFRIFKNCKKKIYLFKIYSINRCLIDFICIKKEKRLEVNKSKRDYMFKKSIYNKKADAVRDYDSVHRSEF